MSKLPASKSFLYGDDELDDEFDLPEIEDNLGEIPELAALPVEHEREPYVKKSIGGYDVNGDPIYLEPVKGKAKDVFIDGRLYKSNQLKPGNKQSKKIVEDGKAGKTNFGRGKGRPGRVAAAGINSWDDLDVDEADSNVKMLRNYMRTEGAAKIIAIMKAAGPDDFLKLYREFAPYVLPKMSATEQRKGDDDVDHEANTKIAKGNKSSSHTITVRDMTRKTEYSIPD